MPDQPAQALAAELRGHHRQSAGPAMETALDCLHALPLPGSERWKYTPVNRLYESVQMHLSQALAADTGQVGEDTMARLIDCVDCNRYPLAAAVGLALGHNQHLTLENNQTLALESAGAGCEWLHIDVPENTQASIEQTLAPKPPETGSARVVTINLGQGAALDHTVVTDTKNAVSWQLISVNQNAGSNYQLHQLSLGGTLERLDTHVRFKGPNAQAHLSGTLLCGETDRCDNQLVLEHAAANCASTARFHGLAHARGKLTFGGRIHILEDGAGTNAALQNPNLLLTDTAEINTKPELEIYNDDVACAHGATVGQLDEDALFYLRSRGISRASAQALLLQGFAETTLTGPRKQELRQSANQRLQQWTR